MKFARSTIWAVPLLALAGAVAWVHPAASQGAANSPGTAAPNTAGGVTMEQFVARQAERIMAADTDGDGRISRTEWTALASMGAGKGGHDRSHMFEVIDANHDGYLDKAEIRSALEQRFHRMDINGDGILTPDERMAARAPHKQAQPAGIRAAAPDQ